MTVEASERLRAGHSHQATPRGAALRSLTEIHKWWASKIGPLLAVAYLGLLIEGRSLTEAAPRLAFLVVSACLLATSAYVINDWFDRDFDRALGKQSTVMEMAPRRVLAVVAGLVVAGVAPWLAIGLSPIAWGALGAIVVLPFVYSAPPVRWKVRGGLGPIADATLAHGAPTVFALSAFGALTAGGVGAGVTSAGAIVWSGAVGLRKIIGHELVDLSDDRSAGFATWVSQVGEARARRLATRLVLPVEVAAGIAVLVGLAWVAPLPLVIFAVIAGALGFARLIGAWQAPLPVVPTATNERAVFYLFYRFWPAMVLAIGLSARDPAYLVVLGIHLALFWPVTRSELSALGVAGSATALKVGWFLRGRLGHPVFVWFRYSMPNWFRYSAWGRVWPWVSRSVPNWVRHRAWPWFAHTAPNWFRYRAWVWLTHTMPNWFRYRLPEHRRALRGGLRQGGIRARGCAGRLLHRSRGAVHRLRRILGRGSRNRPAR